MVSVYRPWRHTERFRHYVRVLVPRMKQLRMLCVDRVMSREVVDRIVEVREGENAKATQDRSCGEFAEEVWSSGVREVFLYPRNDPDEAREFYPFAEKVLVALIQRGVRARVYTDDILFVERSDPRGHTIRALKNMSRAGVQISGLRVNFPQSQ
mmetsp:Transcript_7671/g.23227  ORF Transcript_7671/g.23227 Transcript_7671/m.23227 type:complete len:154 (-) Transcript_7671:2529-2990(-)